MMSSKNHKALSGSPCSTSKGCDISTKTTKWKDDASTYVHFQRVWYRKRWRS